MEDRLLFTYHQPKSVILNTLLGLIFFLGFIGLFILSIIVLAKSGLDMNILFTIVLIVVWLAAIVAAYSYFFHPLLKKLSYTMEVREQPDGLVIGNQTRGTETIYPWPKITIAEHHIIRTTRGGRESIRLHGDQGLIMKTDPEYLESNWSLRCGELCTYLNQVIQSHKQSGIAS